MPDEELLGRELRGLLSFAIGFAVIVLALILILA